MNVIIAKGVQSYGLSQKPVGLLIVKLKRLLGFKTWNLVSQKHLFFGQCLPITAQKADSHCSTWRGRFSRNRPAVGCTGLEHLSLRDRIWTLLLWRLNLRMAAFVGL